MQLIKSNVDSKLAINLANGIIGALTLEDIDKPFNTHMKAMIRKIFHLIHVLCYHSLESLSLVNLMLIDLQCRLISVAH